ncbi:LysR family transcriptional regulator [Nonomuraea sp. NPDC050547]|uniref:LysR family transcriptional regulator n=1 Tax=Nonomuraea sp. NPDC050547 TaxID=3364368 RepID=UPI0037A8FC63
MLRKTAKHGSFNRAAGALRFTPSAISQQIAALERGLETSWSQLVTRRWVSATGQADAGPAASSACFPPRHIFPRRAIGRARVIVCESGGERQSTGRRLSADKHLRTGDSTCE